MIRGAVKMNYKDPLEFLFSQFCRQIHKHRAQRIKPHSVGARKLNLPPTSFAPLLPSGWSGK
jgi:hypothetical protein